MEKLKPAGLWNTSRKEYAWVFPMYLAYCACLIGWLYLPADDNLKMQLLLLLVLVLPTVQSGICMRACRRIEERLDQL